METPFIESFLPYPKKQGKVRDCYDLGDSLLIVSTDRISAFDYVLPGGIPDKGKVLTAMSLFWFDFLGVENHLISTEVPQSVRPHDPEGHLEGRIMVVRKAEVVPFECVVRGYLEGSGWREYQSNQMICGVALPSGLLQCSQLPEPIFTPATKAETGHDENVSFETMQQALPEGVAEELRQRSLMIYERAAELAASRGILIADTKFEFGWYEGELILIDEVLTPDSSRFWPKADYIPGANQKSYDKQFVREFLMNSNWDRNSPPPPLPDEVVQQTRAKYISAYETITQEDFIG